MKKFYLFAVGATILFPLAGCDRNMKFSPVDMWNRSRYKPLEPEPFFSNGSSTQAPVSGTVARGQLRTDELLYQGRKRGSGVAPLVIYSGSPGMSAGAAGAAGAKAGINGSVAGVNGAMNGGNSVTVPDSAKGQVPLGDNGLGTDATLATQFPFPVTKYVLQRGEDRYNAFCSPCHSRVGDGHGMIVERGFSRPPSFHIDRLRKAPVGHYFDVITHGYGAMYPYGSRVETRDRWAIIAYIRLLQSRSAKYGIDGPQTDVEPSVPIFNGGKAYDNGPTDSSNAKTKNSLPNHEAGTEPTNHTSSGVRSKSTVLSQNFNAPRKGATQ